MRATCKDEAKHLALRDYLRSFIESNPAGTRLPSYETIKRDRKVSQDTLERAIKELDEARLIVHKSRAGLFVSKQAKIRHVGLVFGRDIFAKDISPVYRTIMNQICAKAASSDLRFSFFIDLPEIKIPGRDFEVSYSLNNNLESKTMNGLLLLAPRGTGETAWLQSFGLPLVVMSRCPQPAVGVYIDQGSLARKATELLAAKGCRRIAMISSSGHQRDQGFTADIDAYRLALSKAGIEFNGALLWDYAPKPSESVATESPTELMGRAAIDAVLARGRSETLPFDGLISTDDMMTRGIAGRLAERGFVLGRDYQMASHANKGSNVLNSFSEGLDLIEFDMDKLCAMMLATLEDLMRGKGPSPCSTVLLQPETKGAERL